MKRLGKRKFNTLDATFAPPMNGPERRVCAFTGPPRHKNQKLSIQIQGPMTDQFGILEIASWAFVMAIAIPTWRIFARVGKPPALALLCLIPGLGFIVAMYILAFSEWPKLSNRGRQ